MNSLAVDTEIPAFFAKDGLWAAAAIKRACLVDLLGIPCQVLNLLESKLNLLTFSVLHIIPYIGLLCKGNTMDTYVNGELISPEEREKLYLENLDNPVPGVDALWHKYAMSAEQFETIHGYHPDVYLLLFLLEVLLLETP